MVQTIQDFSAEIARLRAQAQEFHGLAVVHRLAGNRLIAVTLTEAAEGTERNAYILEGKLAFMRREPPSG